MKHPVDTETNTEHESAVMMLKGDFSLHYPRFTYEIAPVFVLMEQLTLKKMREIVGWPEGEGDGIFSPGETP